MRRIFRAAIRPLTPLFLLSLAVTPLLGQQPAQAVAPPTAPAPVTSPATTPAPQTSPLFAQNDEHPATIAEAKEENAKSMSSRTTIAMSTMMLVMIVVLLVLLIA